MTAPRPRGPEHTSSAGPDDPADVVTLNQCVALADGFPVLSGVDLRIGRGEVVLLEAPNGAGKTSLLRLCSGLLRLHSGHGEVLGLDLSTAFRAVRQNVAYLGHGAGLFPWLSARKNVEFWSRAHGELTTSSGELAVTVEAVLDAVQLPLRSRDLPARRLSEGQLKRSALAVVLGRRAPLWLLDEPHAGLDEGGRALLEGLIHEAAEAGVTVIFSSHEGLRARSVGARVVRMGAGRVLEDSGAIEGGPA
jgi:heme ABC exporter ATP-binding subunit CcmA